VLAHRLSADPTLRVLLVEAAGTRRMIRYTHLGRSA